MSFENNKPTLVNPAVNGMRDICARRAATIAYMVDEAAKRGLDDSFARDAIARYGEENAEKARAAMKNPDDFSEFAGTFATDHNRDIYEMEVVEKTDDELLVDFHYCPYVAEWVRQGRSAEEIARLCSITMEGDHARAEKFPTQKFHLEGTIADGKPVCRLRFRKA